MILLKRGYVVVMEYPGGVEEWFSNETDDIEETDDDEVTDDDDETEEKKLVYEGVVYNISGKDVMDENFKVIGKFIKKTNSIQWNPGYEKIHNTKKKEPTVVNEAKASKAPKEDKRQKKIKTYKEDKDVADDIEMVKDTADDIVLNETPGITQKEFNQKFRGYGYTFF